MATLIEQHPLYDTLPVGQDVIFAVSNSNIISNFTGVKISAEVHISSGNPPNISNSTHIVGTFKTTPNNAGVGMFDFRPVIESFVKADNLARKDSFYKGVVNTDESNVPIHLIDKYSGNLNSMRYLAIVFTTEYIDPTSGNLVIDSTSDTSDLYNIFNGYLKYTDILDIANTPYSQNTGNNFGYPIPQKFTLDQNAGEFLSNAPTTQYANVEDYGTIAFLGVYSRPSKIRFVYYDSTGSQIGTESVSFTSGSNITTSSEASLRLFYFGCFPANLRNWSTVFNSPAVLDFIEGGYYTVEPLNGANQNFGTKYTFNVNCANKKGFEPIRLTWLNQWGTWDYYTFNMKSTKSISTKGSTYQQLAGTWNEAAYRVDSFKGGKKSFRVNATEKITMNTDFVSESESEWFEDFINSPEVYILDGFQSDLNISLLNISAMNQYVTPVRLTTSSYTKKTIANDKVMQYTFEVEKSKTLRTQSI